MSDAARPDGSDPRVLTPDADEPDVWISRGNSSAKKYHTNECATVEQMIRAKQVPQSVAEWNDHEKCDRCHRIDTGDDYERPGAGEIRLTTGYHTVSPVRCLALRALAVSGDTQRDAADTLGVSQSTAARHIKGECTCDHYGHAVRYTDDNSAEPAADGGVPESVRDGQVFIPPTTCARIRRVLAGTPVSVRPLAAVLGASDSAVRRHAKNEDKCQHDHADAYPPVRWDHDAYEWVSDR